MIKIDRPTVKEHHGGARTAFTSRQDWLEIDLYLAKIALYRANRPKIALLNLEFVEW
jgi:hypothetical protein